MGIKYVHNSLTNKAMFTLINIRLICIVSYSLTSQEQWLFQSFHKKKIYIYITSVWMVDNMEAWGEYKVTGWTEEWVVKMVEYGCNKLGVEKEHRARLLTS